MSPDPTRQCGLPADGDEGATQELHSPPSEPQATIAFADLEFAAAPRDDVTQDFAPAPRLDVFPIHQGGDGHVGTLSSAGFRFRVLRPHAKGGLGLVSLAQDEELHREVALKEIQARHAHDPNSHARFVMEAEITGGLEHPGIVPVYGLGTYSDGRPFYAMRFIRGESLEDAVKKFHQSRAELDAGRATVGLRQLIGSFIDVCHAIEYAHSRGILHRDIKPANIMLGKYGETLVVDWGIAKLMEQADSETVGEESLRPACANDTAATQMGTAVGTPQYMSPEQADGQIDRLGPASDVYSLGATLYFVLTGRPPFEGKRIVEVLANVTAGRFLRPRQIDRTLSRPLEAICLKAMALSSADRYPSPRALSNDLEHWLADEPVTAYRESRWEQAVRWLRHHRSWAQACLAILVSVAAVSIVAALLINEARRQESAARQEADESFAHARQAVNEFFTQVSESTLLDVPGMQPLRKDLLQVALDYEETFLDQRGNDPSLRREVAAASFRAAVATAAIRPNADALPLLHKAREIQEDLLNRDPVDDALRYELSNSYNEIGRSHIQGGRYEEALDWFRKSNDKRRQLVDANQDNAEYQRKLATSHNNIGVVYKMQNEFEQALAEFDLANGILQGLVEADRTEPRYRRDLAMGRYNLGNLQVEAKDYPDAVKSYQQAANDFEKLAQEHVLVIEYAQKKALCYRQLGNLYLELGDFDPAIEFLEKARQIQEGLGGINPYLVELSWELSGTYSSLAKLWELLDLPDDALQFADKTANVLTPLVKTHPDDVRFYRDLAANAIRTGTLLLELDDYPAALQAFEQALAMYQSLEPVVKEVRPERGVCLTNIGLLQLLQDKLELAEQTLREGQALYGELHRDYQDDALLQLSRASLYTNLGLLYEEKQLLNDALQAFAAAQTIHETFIDATALGNQHRVSLSEVLLLIAALQAEQQSDEALQTFQLASDKVQPLIDLPRQRAQALKLMAEATHGRGKLHLSKQQFQESLAAYQQAVEEQSRAFEASERALPYRLKLSLYIGDVALVQNSQGNTDDAVKTTLKRKELWLNDPQQLYDIACDLLALVVIDTSTLSDDQKMERMGHLEQAVDLLADARRAGFEDWDHALSDPKLELIRDLAGFQKLLPNGCQ